MGLPLASTRNGAESSVDMDGAADMAPAKNRTPKLTTRGAAFALRFINDGYTTELEVVKTLNLETASLGKLRRPSSLRDRAGAP